MLIGRRVSYRSYVDGMYDILGQQCANKYSETAFIKNSGTYVILSFGLSARERERERKEANEN